MYLITNPAINPTIGRYPGITGGSGPLQAILTGTISFAMVAGGILTLILFLWGGFEYITAGGDKEATQKATKRISSALIGFVILVSSFAIITLLGNILGMDLLKFDIPTLV